MKGCFFRAKMILLQGSNPKSVTLHPVKTRASSSNVMLFCNEAKKLPFRTLWIWLWSVYGLNEEPCSHHGNSIQDKTKGFCPDGSPHCFCTPFYSLSYSLGFSLSLICRYRSQTVLFLVFPGCTLCLHGECLQAFICVCPSSPIEWIFSGMLKWDGGVPGEEWRERETDLNCASVCRRAREREGGGAIYTSWGAGAHRHSWAASQSLTVDIPLKKVSLIFLHHWASPSWPPWFYVLFIILSFVYNVWREGKVTVCL